MYKKLLIFLLLGLFLINFVSSATVDIEKTSFGGAIYDITYGEFLKGTTDLDLEWGHRYSSGGYRYISRMYFDYDLSVIPVDATITSAEVIYKVGTDDYPRWLYFESGDYAFTRFYARKNTWGSEDYFSYGAASFYSYLVSGTDTGQEGPPTNPFPSSLSSHSISPSFIQDSLTTNKFSLNIIGYEQPRESLLSVYYSYDGTTYYGTQPFLRITYETTDPPTLTRTTTSPPGGSSYSGALYTNASIQHVIACDTNCDYVSYCVDSTNTCSPTTNYGVDETIVVGTEGTTYFRYRANGPGGWSTTQSFANTIDLTDPTSTVDAMSGGSSYTFGTESIYNNITLNFTYSDNIGGGFLVPYDKIYYCNDTLNTCDPLSSSTYCQYGSIESDNCYVTFNNTGVSYVRYIAKDHAGNTEDSISSVSLNLNTDTTPPSLSIEYPVDSALYSSNITRINYTVSDAGVGLSSCYYSLNSATNQTITCGENITGLNLGTGEYILYLYAEDLNGNLATDNIAFDVIVDDEPPEFSNYQVSPNNNTQYSPGRNNIFQVNIVDDIVGLDGSSVKIEFNGTNYTSVTNIGIVWTFEISGLSAGTYQYNWWASDTFGNTNSSLTKYYTIAKNNSYTNLNIDKISPQTYGESINVSCSSSNDEGNLVLYRDGVNVNATELNQDIILGAGTYTYICNVTETQNYTSSTNTTSFVIDKKTPTANLTNTTAWSVELGTSVTIGLEEGNSGDGDVVYVIYENGSGIGTGRNFTHGIGTYIYLLNTTGGANYTASTSLDTETLEVTDTTSPSVNIIFPTATTYDSHNQTLNFSVTDEDSSLTCWKSLNGNANETIDCSLNSTVNYTGVSTQEGENIIYVYAEDSSGNLGYDSVNYYISSSGPAIVLEYPTDNKAFNSGLNIPFNFTATDTSGVDTCELWTNTTGSWALNYTWTSVTSGVTLTTKLNITEGTFKWGIWCNDTLNTESWSPQNYTFIVDETYPLISYNSDTTSSSNLSQDSIYIKVDVTEINFKNITFKANSNTQTYTTETFNHNFTSLSDGTYIINVTICDLSGNCNSTENRTITLDTENPSGELLSPENGSYSNSQSQNFTVNASDSNNLKNYTLYVYNESGLENSFSGDFNGTNKEQGSVISGLLEGIKTWFYKLFDVAGNLFTTSNNTIEIDITTPLLTITSPLNTSYTEDNLEISFSVTDDNYNYTQYSLNGGTTNTTITSGTSIDFTYGSNTLDLYAYDNAGNFNNSEVIFYINYTDALSIDISGNPSTQGFYYNLSLNASINDNNVDISYCNFSLTDPNNYNAILNSNGTKSGDIWSSDYYLLNETGTWTYNVTCRNVLGTSETETGSFTIPTYSLSFFPSSYTFTAESSKDELRTFDVYLYDNTNGTLEVDILYDIESSEYFDFLTSPTSIELSGHEDSENPYKLEVSLQADASVPDGTYNGTITFYVAEADEIEEFEFTYGINPPSGVPELKSSLGVVCTSEFPESPCANTITMLTDRTFSLDYKVNNTGEYNMTQCYIESTYSWMTASIENFNLNSGQTRDINIIYSPTSAGIFYDQLYVICYDGTSLGLTQTTDVDNRPINKLIVTESGDGGGSPGGGGDSGDDDEPTEEDAWSMTTDKDSGSYTFVMSPGQIREREIKFLNLGINERGINLRCEGDLCEYLDFNMNSLILPVGLELPTYINFKLELPTEINSGQYVTNIIGKDDLGVEKVLTIKTNVGAYLTSDIINKLTSNKDIIGIKVPYAIMFILIWILISVIFNYIILKPINLGGLRLVISVLIGLFIATGSLIFL